MNHFIRTRIKGFGHSFQGAKTLFSTQAHAKIHTLATIIVLIMAIAFRVSIAEWALLVFAISIVWLAEALNTAIELLADEISLEWRERIKHAKDVAAFAVLCAAIGAAAIGIIVFLPYIRGIFS